MTWIEKKENWFEPKRQKSNGSKPQKCYSITDVAALFGVSRQTVYNWLSFDEPESALIHVDAWFRLPSGHIRIRESAVVKLQYSVK
jgi:hypothetical protein